MNGGAEEQVLYTLDGFMINDPLTGRLESRLSVEAVRAFELRSGSLPAEYGKGAAGVFAVRTEPGADKIRYTGTNFVPGLEQHKGLTIGAWTPRFGVSGPIRKGRAWISDSIDIQYSNTIVDELEKGRDRARQLAREQHAPDPGEPDRGEHPERRTPDQLVERQRTGLSLSTRSKPRRIAARDLLFNIKDQIAFHAGGLIEFGYAATRNFSREIPQGDGVQIFTPYGLRGNDMMNAVRTGDRDQVIVVMPIPLRSPGAGKHQLKTGIDLKSLRYRQDAHRSGFDYQRVDGSVVRQTRFGGSGSFRNSSREIALLCTGLVAAHAIVSG